MESYIVRVYRNSLDDEQQVAGLVEKVGTSEKKMFQDLSSLQSVLGDIIRTENYNRPETTRMAGYVNEDNTVSRDASLDSHKISA